MPRDPETGDRQQATGNRQHPDAGDLKRGADIADRLVGLAVAVLRLVSTLPNGVAGRHVAGQLVRATTAGGANYEEARAAESRPDFIHKLGVAAKELRESIYWLDVLRRSGMTTVDPAIRSEARQLVAILVASARTARSRLEG